VSHSTLPVAREALKSKLVSEGRIDLAARLEKCGRELVLRCQACTRGRTCLTRCDLKWCPACQPVLAFRTAERYRVIAAGCQWPLMVTWTCTHAAEDSHLLLRHVRRSHTKLRRQRWFKTRQKGGVIAYELTHGDHGWHPHAHSLIDCRWLSVTIGAPPVGADRKAILRRARASCAEVAAQWTLALGRKGRVEVHRVWRRENGIEDSLAEVLKYSTKGSELAELDDSVPIGPVIDMLDLTRNVASWGTFYRHPALKRVKPPAAMCECGCSDWLPEELMLASAVNEYGLTSRQSGRARWH